VRVTTDSSIVRPEDVERLRAEGLDDAAIHDALQVIAYFNYINRIADGVGIEGEPDWLAHP
jgi:alkylhydroperoxidase family enzyme